MLDFSLVQGCDAMIDIEGSVAGELALSCKQTSYLGGALAGFGSFLVRNGVISAEDAVEALDRQRQEQVPIGRLAVNENLLTFEQVFAVLSVQAEESIGSFGEIACDQGLLHPQDIHDLLQLQRTSRPPLGEVLVNQATLTEGELERWLIIYQESLTFSMG